MFRSVLHHEPCRFRDAYLLITVKDSGFLGNGIFLGEALLPMDEIPVTDMDTYLRDLPQIQLPLTKPSGYGDYKFLNTVKAAECNHTETKKN